MNYTNFIVKIISKPQQRSLKNSIPVTDFIAKFYTFHNTKKSNHKVKVDKWCKCKITIWGKSGSDVINHYKLNDYLIVEGYISFRKSHFKDLNITTEIDISVSKLYPFVSKPISLEK